MTLVEIVALFACIYLAILFFKWNMRLTAFKPDQPQPQKTLYIAVLGTYEDYRRLRDTISLAPYMKFIRVANFHDAAGHEFCGYYLSPHNKIDR